MAQSLNERELVILSMYVSLLKSAMRENRIQSLNLLNVPNTLSMIVKGLKNFLITPIAGEESRVTYQDSANIMLRLNKLVYSSEKELLEVLENMIGDSKFLLYMEETYYLDFLQELIKQNLKQLEDLL